MGFSSSRLMVYSTWWGRKYMAIPPRIKVSVTFSRTTGFNRFFIFIG
jgi:hypothetical protein